MKKALIYASVASMIQQFNMNNIAVLQSLGYEVDVACNMKHGSTISDEKIKEMKNLLREKGVEVYHIPIPRKLSAISDIMKSIKLTKELMNRERYQMIHCHSPIGSIICRSAYRISKIYKKAKMIYTAHGFHFFKGAPWVNWMVFYPVEKFFSRYTDILLTINQEDLQLARNRMSAKKVEYIPGIGIDLDRFQNVSVNVAAKRNELGIPAEAKVLLSVGELNQNKNHQVVIKALAELKDPAIYYLIAGQGDKKAELQQLAKSLGIENQVQLLGYRGDINELCQMADLFVFPSYREGLSVAVMEAMASGLPCVVSRIRGNTDLIDDQGGALFDPFSEVACANAIRTTLQQDLMEKGKYNSRKIKNFSSSTVNLQMERIYGEL